MTPDIEQLRNRDLPAWQSLYDTLWPIALSAAGRACPGLSAEDKEDVAIDGIAALPDHLDRITTVDELKPLLAVIARNKAISILRQRLGTSHGGGKVDSLEEKAEEGMEVAAASLPPDRAVQALQMGLELGRLLGNVKDIYAKLLMDRYFLGFDYKELAQRHDLSTGSIGVYLQKGLEELREQIDKNPQLKSELLEFLR